VGPDDTGSCNAALAPAGKFRDTRLVPIDAVAAAFLRSDPCSARLTAVDGSARVGLLAATALIGVAVVASGCDEQKSVFDAGVCTQTGCRKVSAEEALQVGRKSLVSWHRGLRQGVRERPGRRFDNLAPAELRRRLEKAAAEDDFEVVSLKLNRPRQLAPEVVIRTKKYAEVAESAKFWLRAVDPERRTGDSRTGWRFEGFYLRANDEHGVPFFIVFNTMRGVSPGGGMWARSEPLFPFEHG
jgi:hypothetical protein